MTNRKLKYFIGVVLVFLSLSVSGCKSDVDDERIPNVVVNVALDNPGLWNSYGVSGFGIHRNFILGYEPAGFHYKSGSATGYGGVLLIGGLDSYSGAGTYPLAYDLSCPVERKPDIRVRINGDYNAVCPECKSAYDVTMGGGVPIKGEAASGKYKYSLKTYRVIPASGGGYYITN